MGFPGGSDSKESACNVGNLGSVPRLGRSPEEGRGNPLQYFCLENPHEQRSLVSYSPWPQSMGSQRVGHDWEGLQCSCLENPRDRGAWWAAIYGVAQSRTQLKRLSSSSSRATKHTRILVFNLLACCSPCSCKESDTTYVLNTNNMYKVTSLIFSISHFQVCII